MTNGKFEDEFVRMCEIVEHAEPGALVDGERALLLRAQRPPNGQHTFRLSAALPQSAIYGTDFTLAPSHP